MTAHKSDGSYICLPQGRKDLFQSVKAALIKISPMFLHTGAQIPLSAMGKSDWQRRGRETPNLQVCETTEHQYNGRNHSVYMC